MSESVEKLIERYEAIIEDLQSKVDELEGRLERSENYSHAKAFYQPRKIDEVPGIPVPRLQIMLTRHSDYHWNWLSVLVYRHTMGDIVGVPMGETDSRGGHRYDTFETPKDVEMSLPRRDGVDIRRDSAQLNIPAYAVVDGHYHPLTPIPTPA